MMKKLRGVMAVVSMGALLLTTVVPTRAQEQQNPIRIGPPECPPACGGGSKMVPPVNLSVAVAQNFQSKMLTLNNKLQAHQATSATYAAAASAAQAYFANSVEVGWTNIMQRWILANTDLFTGNPTVTQLHQGYNELVAAGAVVTYNQYVQMIESDPLTDREEFLAFVQTYGLSAVHTSIVNQLNVLAADLTNRHNGSAGTIQVNKWSFTWGAVGLYMGIVGLACTGPVGVAIVVGGLAAGAIGLLGDDPGSGD
jgi:hypothetical protein